ncbi:phage minor head protein [Roseovarius sp. MBR-6]|uniref:phage head morphogenesis protein n=1 Tax=Roseovarius sp. MBR-6 TaxID=3156459 RepID=UPI00339387C9
MIDALKRLRPEEALAFFRSKGLAPPDARFDFRDIWRNEHASNFVVAKAMRDEVLETIRGALDRALEGGGTLTTFMDELEPELKRLGWWGRGMERDPLTGALKNVQLGSPRRLRIIFDANMRAAHAAGKWARIERVKDAFPFLRYVQVQRDTKRPEHARYHELIRPVDDPVWERIYPPNGWRCGCTVQQLSQAMMDRRGMSVTEDFTLEERGVLNRRTGQIEPTALGVDPAWDGNPGKAWLDLSGRHADLSGDVPAPQAAAELGFANRARLMGLGDGRAHMGILLSGTAQEVDWRIADGVRASPGPGIRRAVASGGPVAIVQNHPGSRPFSGGDLELALAPGVASILGVGHDGSLFRVRARRAGISVADLTAAAATALEQIGTGDIAAGDREEVLRLSVLRALNEAGDIDYRESLNLQARLRRARLGGLLGAVTARLRDRF